MVLFFSNLRFGQIGPLIKKILCLCCNFKILCTQKQRDYLTNNICSYLSPSCCLCTQDKWRNLSVSTASQGSKEKSRAAPKAKAIVAAISNNQTSAPAKPNASAEAAGDDTPNNSTQDGKNVPRSVSLTIWVFYICSIEVICLSMLLLFSWTSWGRGRVFINPAFPCPPLAITYLSPFHKRRKDNIVLKRLIGNGIVDEIVFGRTVIKTQFILKFLAF